LSKQNQDALKICHVCIGDEFISGEVKTQGVSCRCSYCGRTVESLMLSITAQKIYCVMNRDFSFSPAYPREKLDILLHRANMWTRPGKSPTRVIEEIAGISEDIAEGICAYLSALRENQVREIERDENPFSDDARYVERKPIDLHYDEPWYRLRRDILTRRRFFGTAAGDTLHQIFDGLKDDETVDGQSIIREFGPETSVSFAWRGRSASTREAVLEILNCPVQQLGPPAPRVATGGRMNPTGIPMFYGATDKSTVISEVRPVIGGFVVVGKFEFLRKLRIIDLDAMTEVSVDGSRFDPEYPKRRSRAAFLKRFVREIGTPVLPGDEILGYLITQMISEFFANEFAGGLDGMIYKSSQTDGDGRNLVLFNHACQTRSIDCTKSATRRMESEDVNDDENERWKIVIDTRDNKGKTCHEHANETRDQCQPTLGLDLDDVEVYSVTGVRYEKELVNVQRF